MQIKLVILTICASLIAIGFADPPPIPSEDGPLDALIPGDGHTSGTDDLGLLLPDANDPGATSTEGKPPQNPAGQVQKRKIPLAILRKGRRPGPVQKPAAPPPAAQPAPTT
ncbi:hypothetical protein RMATCC62417_13533 [Rhizopus microsporus]|nr:hypothetical protein RMATCC62417_13533 [Rhizopus microsporus]